MSDAAATLSPAQEALSQGVVSVDVVSDVVCPWCYVGKRRLEAAVVAGEQSVAINWRPFQLDPTIPPAGLDRRAYLARKFNDDDKLRAIHEHLTALGREVGIAFAFERIERAPNTLDAHRLIRWAASSGHQGSIVETLFHAYFVEGEDIGSSKVLTTIAGRCGMDETIVHRMLASGTDVTEVRDEIATAVRLGVSGVPFFIFAGRYAVPGAQPADVLAAAITKARDDEPVRANG